MSKEAVLIMKRRFLGRVLESGLLIIAVALGVGVAASGLSLFFNNNSYANELLNSPEYREIVVTTRDNMEDMELPVLEKSSAEGVILTSKDLKSGEIIEGVSYSYIMSDSHIWLMNEEVVDSKFSPQQRGPNKQKNDSSSEEYRKKLDEVKNNPDYIVADLKEIFGKEISKDFFSAWDLTAKHGSLFTNSEYISSESYIIVGSSLAKDLTNNNIDSIIGKKLVSWFNLYTIIGVLDETGSSYDKQFFTPKKELSESGKFQRLKGRDNSQLRFFVSDIEILNNVASDLYKWFSEKYGEDQIAVSNPREEAKRVTKRNRGISILILFLSMAGLFIASINVSNILISRSIRMKRHVGILKALGASKLDIIKLFIKEASFVTLAGSVLGTLLAIPLSTAMQSSLGIGDLSWIYILTGVLLSSMLTLTFSVLPVIQNSKIEAADAMRSAG